MSQEDPPPFPPAGRSTRELHECAGMEQWWGGSQLREANIIELGSALCRVWGLQHGAGDLPGLWIKPDF